MEREDAKKKTNRRRESRHNGVAQSFTRRNRARDRNNLHRMKQTLKKPKYVVVIDTQIDREYTNIKTALARAKTLSWARVLKVIGEWK